MFSTNFSKICCSFAQNNFFEKYKILVKMADSSQLKLTCYYGKQLAISKLLACQSFNS